MVLSISGRHELITEIGKLDHAPVLNFHSVIKSRSGSEAHVIAQLNGHKKIDNTTVCAKYTEQSPQHKFTATQLVQDFNEGEKNSGYLHSDANNRSHVSEIS